LSRRQKGVIGDSRSGHAVVKPLPERRAVGLPGGAINASNY
jgi:hypothetical protein